MTKQPALEKSQLQVGKTPRTAFDPGSFYKRNPSWRVRRVELVDPFGWHALDKGKLTEVRQKLANFESMTWSDILVRAKNQNHAVRVQQLCSQARKRLAQMGLDEFEDLVSLRLSARERVWGILAEGVLELLWWDPDHKVCPSLPRNT